MLEIRPDDLSGPEIADLIAIHAGTMLAASPPESCHFLPIDGLRVTLVQSEGRWSAEAGDA